MKRKSTLQTILIELCKQPKTKTTINEQITLVIVSVGVDVVAKTEYDIYVLSIIKVYSFYLFSLLCQRRLSC